MLTIIFMIKLLGRHCFTERLLCFYIMDRAVGTRCM